jgi:hypothetical protein
MNALLWKECRENLKWAAVPIVLILCPTGLFGAFELMDEFSLFFVSLIAAVFGAALGFLQVFFESSGDKRSLLLHRPLSPSQIFLGKALAGVGLYLLALGIPFATVVVLAAVPGHTHQPFGWPMVLPWLADSLTGLVYYFAGMLTAQREARWYGSRCLGLATGLFCSIVVWTVPEFWQALGAIVIVGGLTALAAWGSFAAGGAYAPQPRLARMALALTFLIGLSALSFTGTFFAGMWLARKTEYPSSLDRHGHVLLVAIEDGQVQSVTDLAGNLPPELHGKRLGRYELKSLQAVSTRGGTPKIQSYRNRNRYLVEYVNDTKPGGEAWWYVPEQGRLLGYDKKSKRFIGSFGPDGYVRPDEPPRGRFQGETAHLSFMYFAKAADYLAFPGGVYRVDFDTLTVRTLFVPRAGETVLWASRWEDEKQKLALAFVGTDQSVHVMDEAGSRILSVPLAYDPHSYRVKQVGRLENPERYWVWYEPAWYLDVGTLETTAEHVVIYDRGGRELTPRQEIPPQPGRARQLVPPAVLFEPSSMNALAGAVTSPAEAAVLIGTTRQLESDVRANNGTAVPLALRFLIVATQFFLPGIRWNPPAHTGLVVGFGTLMLLSAVTCALVCALLSRRYAFSRARGIGWTLCGFLCGPAGLLLMLAVQEWPARVACPGCGRPRLVTRDACEHCGAPHAVPAPDGTEVFEQTAASADTTLAGY